VAKYYFLQGVILVVIAGPSLEMSTTCCMCMSSSTFNLASAVWEGRVSPVIYVFCFQRSVGPSPQREYCAAEDLFLGEGGHSNKA
jgi:hypothetical protein